ncbi:hypothetical protein IIA28_01165 [candidate division KSB1 bacterium]|nr:hypothetical protein [candidate division KSB1 bacterium]
MPSLKLVLLFCLFPGLFIITGPSFAQEKGTGDLEDFADDFGEEESGSDSDTEESARFFLWLFFESFSEISQLWGGTPETEFGPFPSHPYDGENGFMSHSDDYRSYFFTTEFSYHQVHRSNVRSFMLKWETQFVRSSKLAFDVAFYQEDLFENGFRQTKDQLTFWGIRYGHSLYRSPQMILNLEGGFRGFHRNRAHGGPEIAVDLQFFPKKPLIIETSLAVAYISNAPLYTVEANAGILFGRFEVLGGLRILKNKSSDLLDGFKVGLRVWY